MIETLTLKNFRNFSQKKLHFGKEKNIIIGNNGTGKTNILEALSLLSGNTIIGIEFDNLVKNGEDFFYIECIDIKGNTASISYDKKEKKKYYIYNKKRTNRKKFTQYNNTCVIFSPIMMNLMYLSPSLRRGFIDTILINAFPEYSNILKTYKKVLLHRNKFLKNIREQKSKKEDISFWNNEFIKKAVSIYQYRFKIIHFITSHINEGKKYFNGKIQTINFEYITQIKKENIQKSLAQYLEHNINRDIILGNTHIGPHRDDFSIGIDNQNIVEYASRGEIKSIIIFLKFMEAKFTEQYTQKKPIFIVDVLISELDEIHKMILLKGMNNYQTFFSGIKNNTKEGILITL